MSALKITDKVLEELDEQLSFSTNPIFEKPDIECVLFAFRTHTDPMEWVRCRRDLFDNPDIVKFTESVLNGIQETA